tara:strand:+ start:7505 stop:7897 length:393 start_codon:yes stop_codon:yes gene_type:complete
MQERHFINKIHKRLSSDIYKWKINDAYHGGVPDVFYSGPGGHCFVEYKYKKELPKKHNTYIKFGVTAQQCAWLNARKDEGVPVFVALGVGKSIVFNNNFDVVNVYTVRDYITEAMSIDDFIDELEKICIK